MTKTILTTIVLSTILLTSMTSAMMPAFAAPVWTASGPGTVTVTDADQASDGLSQFTYLLNPAGFSTQTWVFETNATQTGPVTLFYDWSGFHAFFQVTTTLEAFDPNGTIPILSDGPVNCCTAPSAGFHNAGSVTFNVVAGQPYGFKLSGSNSDSDNRLLGTLTVADPQVIAHVNVLNQDITDLQAQLADCQNSNTQLTTDLNQCTTDNGVLNQQVTDLNQEIIDLQAIIADFENGLSSLPSTVIASLIGGINSLVDGDMLDAKDAKKSIKKLDEGLKKLEHGNEKACHEVEKFVKEVNKLVDKEELDAAKAQPLLDEAASMLSQCPVDSDHGKKHDKDHDKDEEDDNDEDDE